MDFGARVYDSRLGRFLSVDPLFSDYSHLSTYVYGENSPIWFIDINGNYASPPPPHKKAAYIRITYIVEVGSKGTARILKEGESQKVHTGEVYTAGTTIIPGGAPFSGIIINETRSVTLKPSVINGKVEYYLFKEKLVGEYTTEKLDKRPIYDENSVITPPSRHSQLKETPSLKSIRKTVKMYENDYVRVVDPDKTIITDVTVTIYTKSKEIKGKNLINKRTTELVKERFGEDVSVEVKYVYKNKSNAISIDSNAVPAETHIGTEEH